MSQSPEDGNRTKKEEDTPLPTLGWIASEAHSLRIESRCWKHLMRWTLSDDGDLHEYVHPDSKLEIMEQRMDGWTQSLAKAEIRVFTSNR